MITPSRPEDIDELVEVAYNSFLSQFAQQDFDAVPTKKDILKKRISEADVQSVYRVNSDIAGFIQADTKNEHIDLLAVSQEYSRQGIGSALLKHAEEVLASHQAKTIFVQANGHAADFYQHQGYEIDGFLPNPSGIFLLYKQL